MYRLFIKTMVFCQFLLACQGHLLVEKNNAPQGYADSQVVGTWKITAYTSNAPYDWNHDGNVETNIYQTWSSCEKDNLYQFVGDKTGTFKLNCSLTAQGSWDIINTLYLYYLPAGQGPESEKFISMTSVEFKTIKAVTTTSGQNFTLTKTWTRQ